MIRRDYDFVFVRGNCDKGVFYWTIPKDLEVSYCKEDESITVNEV